MSQRPDCKPFINLSQASYSRVFAAITVPDGPRELLWQTVRQRVEHPHLRWTAPENFHITLAFMGNLEQHQLSGLCRDIAACTPPEAPVIKPQHIGRFPGPQGHILAAHIQRNGLLIELHHWIVQRARLNGIDVLEEEQYLPHITLARLDKHSGRPFAGTEMLLDGSATFTPSNFGIFRGVRSRREDQTRYHYEPLALFPFADSTSANAGSSSGN